MADNKKPSINLNGAEIKRLAEDALKPLEPFEVRDIVARMQETINRQQAEIERLKNECFCIANECDAIKDCIDTAVEEAKAEAIKEFAERLKKCSQWLPLTAIPDPFVTVNDIDNLVKEMVGD